MHTQDEFRTVFLIVSERSGANLLLNMVAAHPRLCAPLPPHFLRHMSVNLARYGDLHKSENWRSFISDTIAFAQNVSEPWTSLPSFEEVDGAVSRRSYQDVFRVIMDREISSHDASYALLKENEVFRFMPALLLSFPGVRFVWQVRDPRDMMTSFNRSTLFSKLIADPIGIWELEQQQTLNVHQFLKDRGRIHFQRYEDLISEPEETLRNLCAFIGVEFDAQMLQFHEGQRSRRRAQTSDLRKNVAKPVMADNAGRFRSELSEEATRTIENRVGGLMEMLGYKREFPQRVSKEQELALRQKTILADQSTSLEDRQLRVNRIEVVRRLLARPFPSIRG